jgi:S1-C subfamily serine protease
MKSIVIAALVGALAGAGAAVVLDDDPPAPRPAPTTAAADAPPPLGAVFQRSRRALVRVDARPPGTPVPKGRPSRDDGVATGSGFLIDRDGSIVTNEHVVAGGSVVSVRFRAGAPRIRARVVGRDRDTDIALLRIPAARVRDARPLPLGSSSGVRVGDPAIALGNPLGLERTLTLGVVSATDREIEAPSGEQIEDVVQTDASINPGSSGGPLLDARGRVIGVSSQAEAAGIGYAVPVDTLKRVVRRLSR